MTTNLRRYQPFTTTMLILPCGEEVRQLSTDEMAKSLKFSRASTMR